MLKNKKIWIFLALAFALFFLNHRFGWSKYLGNTGNLSFLKEMVRENLAGASLLYIAVTVVGCVVLALPGITFALFAGVLFGPWLGILLCLVATTAGASAAFLVGRFFLKDTVKPMVQKNKYLGRLLFEESGKSALMLLMITRLVPLFPYNLQNFAYGVTDIGFWKYTAYTFVFMLPGVAFITIGAAGLTATANRWMYFAAAGLLFAAVTLIGLRLKRKHLKKAKA